MTTPAALWRTELALLACAVTALVTPLWARAALRWGWVDRPNARSLHHRAVPRAGGLAMAAGLAACLPLMLRHEREPGALLAVWGAAGVALVGLGDDRWRLAPAVRLLFQCAAAIALVLLAPGDLERLPLPPPLDLPLGWGGAALAVLWIVALVNFYNFLDGVDGLAALQGVVTGLGIALASWNVFAASWAASVAGACLGFLLFNWSPARIFMGDVGSGLLGFSFAAAALLAPEATRPQAVLFTAASLWLFLADATWTLLRRWWRGERWYEAHRQHAYQRLVLNGWSHARVTCLIACGSAALTAVALRAWRTGDPLWWGLALALAAGLFGLELFLARERP